MSDRSFTVADARQYLLKHDLLGHLDPEELAALLASAHVERLTAGEVVFRQGETDNRLFVVLDGRVMISTKQEPDKVNVLNVLGAGRIFGEIALLAGGARVADAASLVESHLLVIERDDFILFLRQHGDVALRLIAALCEPVRRVSEPEWYEATRLAKLPVRLARKLLLLADVYGKPSTHGVRIDLGLSQQDLGEMTSASRESINMQMRSWRKQRLVEVDAGTIIICDPDRLKRIVEAS